MRLEHSLMWAALGSTGNSSATLATTLRSHFTRSLYHCDETGCAVALYRFTPNINIFRDPRWGRGQETPGEDPYLTSEFGIAFVRGMQEGEDPRYLKTAADCKHFAGYDLEDWHGNDRSSYNANISARDLVESYLPPFESCVNDAHVASIMCSYK